MNQKTSKTPKTSNLALLPILILPFISLVVTRHSFSPHLDQYSWFKTGIETDFFLYGKMSCLIVISAVMLAILIAHYARNRFQYNLEKKQLLQWCPILIYMALAILSTILSEYPYFGIHGGVGQFEPIWVILGYGVILFYVYTFCKEEASQRKALTGILIAACLVGGIGTLQFLGFDLLKLEFLQDVICHGNQYRMGITANKGVSYTTLFNPNYVGVYAVVLIPVAGMLTCFARKMWLRILALLTTVFTGISLVGATSKSGLMVLGVCFLLFLVIFHKELVQKKWMSLVMLGVALLYLFWGFSLMKDKIVTSVTGGESAGSDYPQLDSMKTNTEDVTLGYHGHILHFQYDMTQATIQEAILVTDEKGEEVSKEVNGETREATITDQRFPEFVLSIVSIDESKGSYGLGITYHNRSFVFTKDEEEGYLFYTPKGMAVKLDSSQIEVFEPLVPYEAFASHRGYIWSRTIPLLKHRLVLGSGPDTFAVTFPNDDYLGMWSTGFYQQVVTKPHSLYLQMACQTGVPSAIAMIGAWLLYAGNCLKCLRKKGVKTSQAKLSAAIFISSLGFMVMGLTNDSSITVTPVFLVLIGIGLALNQAMGHDIEKIVSPEKIEYDKGE